jgi:hypothetical protein
VPPSTAALFSHFDVALPGLHETCRFRAKTPQDAKLVVAFSENIRKMAMSSFECSR